MFVLAEPIRALVSKWKEEAVDLRIRFGEGPASKTLESLSEELLGVMDAAQDRLFNLEQAAAAAGYSADHLGRQVRVGKIPNAGRPNAPKIALRDLPMKAGHLPSTAHRGELTVARAERIARSIVSPEEGHDG